MKEHFRKKETIEKIMPVIENTAMRYNLIPLEVSLEKEGGKWFLRIFIYSIDHPVNHQDCENISRSLGDMFDEIIPFKYYLEVSSPGLDKKLKSKREFEIFKGHNIIIKTKNEIEQGHPKTFKAKIEGYSDIEGLKILSLENNKNYNIEQENIFSVKLNDIEGI